MGLTGPAPAPAPAESESPAWRVGGATVIAFVAVLWVVEAVDQACGHRLDRYGIRPLEADGLAGVLFAPLLHASWGHLIANTGPLLVLGFLMTLGGLRRFFLATAIIWGVGGLGTWLIGDVGAACGPTDHIGASGLIFGWLTFLIVFGWFAHRVIQVLIGVVVLFAYDGLLWGAVPMLHVCGGVSWQGHLCGALAGLLAAYLLASPERSRRRAAP